jgi:hypothetical protein
MALTKQAVLSTVLLYLSTAFASPQHGGMEGMEGMPGMANMPATVPQVPVAQKIPAPAGCKKLPIDSDWPSLDVVNAELPGWEKMMPDGDHKHPDYLYEVKTVKSVQRAVNFCAKHNVRLAIFNTGHDFIGRYVFLTLGVPVVKLIKLSEMMLHLELC